MSALIIGAYWFFVLRLDESEEAELRKRLQPSGPQAQIPKQFRLLKPTERLSNMPQLDSVLAQMGRLTAPVQRDITQAGMTTTVGTLLLAASCLALLGFVLVKWFFFHSLLAMAVGFLLFFVPFMFVRHKKSQRLKKFEEQFPEAIDLIARALRAGHAFTTGLVDGCRGDPRSLSAKNSSCSTTVRISACRCRKR